MAKESMKAREVKREKLANRYAHKREEIAAKLKSGEIDHEEAWIALSKLPRKAICVCSASAVSSSARWPRRV